MIEGVDRLEKKRAWGTVALLTTCYAMSIADRLVVSLLVDPIKADLHLSDVQMSLILGPAFAVLYAVLSVPLGRLADLANRRNLIAASLAAWSAFTIACGLAVNFVALLISRMGVGVGEAGLTPAAYSIFADRFAPSRLGRATGTYLTGGVIGNTAAFLGGAALYAAFASHGGLKLPVVGTVVAWQLTLITLGFMGLLLTLIVRLCLNEPERAAKEARPSIKTVFLCALRPAYAWTWLAYGALCIVVYGYLGWLPAYLMRTFNLPVATVGNYVGLIVLTTGLIGPLVAGWAADKWHGRHTTMAPMCFTAFLSLAVGLVSFFTFQAQELTWALVGCAIVSLLTSGMLVLVPLTIQLLSGSRMRGQMIGVTLMVGNVIGQSLGPTSIAFLSETGFSNFGMGPAMATTFCASALICAFAALRAFRALPSAQTRE